MQYRDSGTHTKRGTGLKSSVFTEYCDFARNGQSDKKTVSTTRFSIKFRSSSIFPNVKSTHGLIRAGFNKSLSMDGNFVGDLSAQ